MSQGGMHPGRPPVPLMVGECDEANRALFWDGDPTKQSFIRVVGLSTPRGSSRASRTRPRPSSAPARRVKTSGLASPRQDQSLAFTPTAVPENSYFKAGEGCTTWGSLHARGGNETPTSNNNAGSEDVEKGRVRILEHRLRQLMQENARMRDAMLNKADEVKLGRLAEAQRRNQELIAALEAAKEGTERKTSKAQHRARVLQNELWRKRSRQESASATRQQEASAADRVAESLVKASRPHSAPRISLQCAEVGTLKSSVPTSAREDGTSEGGFEVTTKPDHKKAGVDEDQKTGSPRAHQSFVAARPAVNANAWRSPSPIRRSKAATSNDRSFSSGLAAGTRRGSVTDGPSSSLPAHERTNEPKNASDASSKEKSTATGGSRRKRRQQPSEHNEIAVIRKIPGGNNSGHDGNGYRNTHRDTAPKVLLAREAEAAVRRAEREAAAREKEEREMQLSSSFRAKELHATSGPDWATIKAHQDMVRKQRTRDRAAFLAATSSLPARMARHAAMQAVGLDREGRKRGNSGSGPRDREEGVQGAASTGIEEPQNIGKMMHRRQERWKRLLAAAKAASRMTVTRPRTPPMEKRRLAQEARRRARDKAERRAIGADAEQRAEDKKRQFQQLIAMYRASGTTFRETKASVRKAEETRLKIEQDLELEQQKRAAALAEEARRREVSRAVREYVAASEARRREEHGAGPPLDELIRRKKEEKEAEYRERRRLNRSGLRQALRKRPNLLERQEKYAQQHSRRLAAQASTARDFLEGREGFAAAGRRALRDTDGGWVAKAATDDTFTADEKAELGLPEGIAVSCGGSDSGGVQTKSIAENRHESSIEEGQSVQSAGGTQAPTNGHDASAGDVKGNERVLSSSAEVEAPMIETDVGGDDLQKSGLTGNAEMRVQKAGSIAERAASTGSSVVSAGESTHGGGAPPEEGREKLDSATELNAGEDIIGHNEHAASGPTQRSGDMEGQALDSGSEGRNTTDSR